MPIARVKTAAEQHVPLEMLQVKETFGIHVITRHLAKSGLAPEERDAHIEAATMLTLHLRELLGLRPDEWLVSAGSRQYHEADAAGNDIPENGALTLRPVVESADGSRRTKNAIWFDTEFRPEGPVTEADAKFAGQLALASDALGNRWQSHRLSEWAVTPRDAFHASRMARVIQLRPVVHEAAMEQPAELLAGTA